MYSIHTYMLDQDEADILSIAVASWHGQPMYHGTHSQHFTYSMIYGPLTFLVYRFGLLIGNGRFWVLRAMLVAANVLLCFVLFSMFRRSGLRRGSAFALLSLPISQLLVVIKCQFSLRSDVWIVLAMALAARSVLIESDMLAAVLTGLFAGLAIGFKATVGLAFLLLILMVYRRSGRKFAAVTAAVGTLTALAPFLLPNISLRNYWSWLTVAKHEGVSASMLSTLLAYAVFMVLPIVVLRICGIAPWPGRSGWRALPEIGLLTFCLLAVTLVAAKPGAGVWHFWQLMPVVAVYVALAVAGSTATEAKLACALAVIALGSTAVALRYVPRDIYILKAPSVEEREVLRLGHEEIAAYLQRYRGRSVQMGFGDQRYEPVETLRYIPVMHGQPYTVDSRFEIFFQPFPPGVLQKMDACTNDVWLIPHSEQPFVLPYILPPVLHETFIRDYAIEEHGRVLDAWVCKPH